MSALRLLPACIARLVEGWRRGAGGTFTRRRVSRQKCFKVSHAPRRQAWRLLAVFVSTIVGLVLTPLPAGVVALFGLAAAVVSGAMPFAQAFGAFADTVPWMILLSMFLAQAIGERPMLLFFEGRVGSKAAWLDSRCFFVPRPRPTRALTIAHVPIVQA